MTRLRQAGLFLAALVVVAGIEVFLQDNGAPTTAAPTSVSGTGLDDTGSLVPKPSGDDVFTGEVVRVSDGDTLVVDVVTAAPGLDLRVGQEVKIRLLRIDTPELAHDDQELECWGQEAADALRALAPRGALLTFQYDVERQDRFGRDLAHVWLDNGLWVNGEMLARGHARVVTFRPNVAHEDEVWALQDAARADNLGMWGACPA